MQIIGLLFVLLILSAVLLPTCGKNDAPRATFQTPKSTPPAKPILARNAEVIFLGYEESAFGQGPTAIILNDGRYGKVDWFHKSDPDGFTAWLEVATPPRHLPQDADLVVTMVDRIGEPDSYWLLKDGRLRYYLGCEFGPCNLKRVIEPRQVTLARR